MAFAADLPDDEGLGQPARCDLASDSAPASAATLKKWLERHKVTLSAYATGLLLLGLLAAHIHPTLVEITAPMEIGGPVELGNR